MSACPPSALGQTICGTAFSSLEAARRDTDWFEVTTEEDGAFLWEVTAQFDAITGVVQQVNPGQAGCDNLTGYIYPGWMMGPCVKVQVVTDVMPAGTYYFFVAPQMVTAAAWGSPYVATLMFPAPTTGACCDPATGTCTETAEADCTGNWLGLGTTCTPNICPQPTGSCCHADGTCTVTTQADCTGFWTLGGTCDPNPCVCGDFTGDGLVNDSDYWYIHDGMGYCAPQANYASHALADLDHDGCITLVDYQKWLTCYRAANGKDFRVPQRSAPKPTLPPTQAGGIGGGALPQGTGSQPMDAGESPLR